MLEFYAVLFILLGVVLSVTGLIVPWLLIGLVMAVINLYTDRNDDHSIVDRRVPAFIATVLMGVISVFATREHIGGTFFGKELYFNVIDFKFGKRKKWSEMS